MNDRVDEILQHYGITLKDEVLQHAGVKGMKWGRRKAVPQSSPTKRQLKRERDKVFIEELKKAQLGGKRKLSDMEAIKKAENSKRYKEIDNKVKTTKTKGQLKRERDKVFIEELKKAQIDGKLSDMDAIKKAANSKRYKEIDKKVNSMKSGFFGL